MSRRIRTRRKVILAIAAAAMILAAAVYVAVPKGVTSLDLISSSDGKVTDAINVFVGEEIQLECNVKPAAFAQRKAVYAIADEKVAVIDESGILKGIKEGETRLTVSCAGVRMNYTVNTEPAVEDIKGLETTITLTEGEEYQLEPKIIMAEKGLEKPIITYKSKRVTIAEVDKNGKITAVKEGSTTIRVTAGEITKKIKITVAAANSYVDTNTYIQYDTPDTNTTTNNNNRRPGNNRKPDRTNSETNNSDGNNNSGNDNSGESQQQDNPATDDTGDDGGSGNNDGGEAADDSGEGETSE